MRKPGLREGKSLAWAHTAVWFVLESDSDFVWL